jgi:hypothetical protein
MMTKKILAVLFLPLLMASFLSAQSLAELSKKEKERRAALKGKRTVVTNDDLGKVKKKPGVSTGQPAKTGEETRAENPGASAETATPPEGEDVQAEQSPPADQEPVLTDQQFNAEKTQLEDQLNRAQELVDLLTMKMNALWQQFYNMDNMETRDKVQLEISETYNKLLEAEEGRLRAEEELNNFVSRPRN